MIAWLLAVGTLVMGCDTTKCTGLKTFQVVENHHMTPWSGTTHHGRCSGWDFCVMEGDVPACVPWWSALGRSPWLLGALAFATVFVTLRVSRKRQRQALEKTPPIDSWRPPPAP